MLFYALIFLGLLFLHNNYSLAVIQDKILAKVNEDKESFMAQFPYTVYFRYGGVFASNGVLISNDWILTTAHCFQNIEPAKLEVIGGERQIVFYRNPAYMRRAKEFILHSDYDVNNGSINDIALIHLIHPFNTTTCVRPINLGTVEDKDGVPVLAAGWGEINNRQNIYYGEPLLKHVVLYTLKTAKCFNVTGNFSGLLQKDAIMCGYSGGRRGVSDWDSGAPLVRVDNGKLVGIFTGVGDCSGKNPLFYVRVEMYKDWIQNKTGLKINLD